MGNSSRKTVVLERKKSENGDGREAAVAISSGSESRGTETAVLVGSDRRVVKVETPALEDGARGRSVMGRPSNDISEQISAELRGLYAEVLSQPVPDRFLDLLNRLETAAISSPGGTKAPGKK
jgi:hypothetical protein